MNTMTERYRRAFEYLMELEKAFSNHPRDPGGKTAWGITERDWPRMFFGGPPTREEAEEFYLKERYWQAVYDEIADERIAMELFEAGVLCGRHRAVRFLQTSWNYLAGSLWTGWPLKVDGMLGPLTLRRVNEFCGRQPEYANALYRAMNQEQGEHFKAVANPAFIRGWFAKRLN